MIYRDREDEIKSIQKNTAWTTPCAAGHVFIYSGWIDDTYEGCPCECVKTTAHWEVCEKYGSRILGLKQVE